MRGRWWLAAIEPAGRPGVAALPKGLIDRGEDPQTAALREVLEETGLVCEPLERLSDVRYVYTRGGRRIFKMVVFFLVRAHSGRIGAIDPAMRREVASVHWMPLEEWERLSYRGERQVAREAYERLHRTVASTAAAWRRAADGES
jgi:bis(5'-nucleosidyl)-tetraphosphatase